MTDAKPALGSHETFERACNALHLEVDGSIAESVRAIGRAALNTERAARLAAEARMKELETALREAIDRLIATENVDTLNCVLNAEYRAVLGAALKAREAGNER